MKGGHVEGGEVDKRSLFACPVSVCVFSREKKNYQI